MENTNQTYNDKLERLRLEFIAEHEAGKRPTLESLVRRAPEHAASLTDFVTAYLRQESATAKTPLPETASEATKRGIARALQSLGFAEPAITSLVAAREARGWEAFELAKRLSLPNKLVIELERGRISDCPARLRQLLAAAFETTQETVQGWLESLRAQGTQELQVAYLAEGDPEVAALQRNRQATLTFAEALGQARLTPQQKAFWADPERLLDSENPSA
jgi:transcriptional regulator with XRE-family HTH domain